MPPTFSPAPTWMDGCDEPHNFHLDKCFRKRYKPKASAVAWDALGSIGQFSVMLVLFMAVTLSVSIFWLVLERRGDAERVTLGFSSGIFLARERRRGEKQKIQI